MLVYTYFIINKIQKTKNKLHQFTHIGTDTNEAKYKIIIKHILQMDSFSYKYGYLMQI